MVCQLLSTKFCVIPNSNKYELGATLTDLVVPSL